MVSGGPWPRTCPCTADGYLCADADRTCPCHCHRETARPSRSVMID